MTTDTRPTITTMRLAGVYVLMALGRQVAHDVRNLWRWLHT